MSVTNHQIDAVVRPHMYVVSVGWHSIYPRIGVQEMSVPVKARHSQCAPLKDVDSVVAVDLHPAQAVQGEPCRQLGPISAVLINVVSNSNRRSHNAAPLACLLANSSNSRPHKPERGRVLYFARQADTPPAI